MTTRRTRCFIFFAAGLLALVAACAGDGPTRPAATSGPRTPAPEATPGAGPLLVFAYETESAPDGGPGPLQIETYDLGSRQLVASFEPLGYGGYARDAVLAGERVMADFGYTLESFDLYGGHDQSKPFQTVDFNHTGLAVSPDAKLVAITYANAKQDACDDGGCIPASETGGIAFVDGLTGDLVRYVARYGNAGLRGFDGELANPSWRSDGRGIVVVADTSSSRAGSVATVRLDGSATIHDVGDYGYRSVSPNGRFFAEGAAQVRCDETIDRSEVAIRDLDSGTIVASVRDDRVLFAWHAWSPDGSELLYSTYTLTPVPDALGCTHVDEASVRWHILPADGSPSRPVADELAAHRAWYGDRAVEYECRGERLTISYCFDATTRAESIDVYVGGTRIGGGLRARVLGFIEP